MMKFLFPLLLIVLLFACEKDGFDIAGSENLVLLYQTSFDDLSTLEAENWNGNFELIADAPSVGGNSCLALEPQWLPSEGYGAFIIPFTITSGVFRLEFWSKTIHWSGSVTVTDLDGEEEVLLHTTLSDQVWTFYSFDLDLNLEEGTSVELRFSAGGTEVATGKVLVDELALYEM